MMSLFAPGSVINGDAQIKVSALQQTPYSAFVPVGKCWQTLMRRVIRLQVI
jgi:hypothetical protein